MLPKPLRRIYASSTFYRRPFLARCGPHVLVWERGRPTATGLLPIPQRHARLAHLLHLAGYLRLGGGDLLHPVVRGVAATASPADAVDRGRGSVPRDSHIGRERPPPLIGPALFGDAEIAPAAKNRCRPRAGRRMLARAAAACCAPTMCGE